MSRPKGDYCVGYIGPHGDIRAYGHRSYETRKAALEHARNVSAEDVHSQYCVLKVVQYTRKGAANAETK